MPILPDARKSAGRYFSHRTRNPTRQGRALLGPVIPAQAGIHFAILLILAGDGLDSRLRGNDKRFDRTPIPNETQPWSQHFRFTDYRIEGLTAVGRATVEALNLNHGRRQRIREIEEAFGLYPEPL